jgi:hypothetical protein
MPRLVTRLVVDYSTSRRLVVDYSVHSDFVLRSHWPVVDYSVRRDFVLRPHWLYFSHIVRRNNLFRGNTVSTSTTPRAAATSSFGRIVLTIHLD